MRIAVVGAGGVGGAFGAALAKAGADVTFIARGAHLAAMKERGLLSDDEHSVTRLQRLNLTDSQQQDAVTYEPGQIVEFHKIAKAAVRAPLQPDAQGYFWGGAYPSVSVCMKATNASSSWPVKPRLPVLLVFMFSVVSGAGQHVVPSRGSCGPQRGSTSRVL